MELPEVERIVATEIRPGDTLFVTLPPNTPFPEETIERLRGVFEERFPGTEVFFLVGIDVQVVRA